jgi:hypothetical protein
MKAYSTLGSENVFMLLVNKCSRFSSDSSFFQCTMYIERYYLKNGREVVFSHCILNVSVARIAHTRGMTTCWLHVLGDGGCCVQKYQNEAKLLAWLLVPRASIDTGVL